MAQISSPNLLLDRQQPAAPRAQSSAKGAHEALSERSFPLCYMFERFSTASNKGRTFPQNSTYSEPTRTEKHLSTTIAIGSKTKGFFTPATRRHPSIVVIEFIFRVCATSPTNRPVSRQITGAPLCPEPETTLVVVKLTLLHRHLTSEHGSRTQGDNLTAWTFKVAIDLPD